MAVAEGIVICIDNSRTMLSSKNYKAQLDAIEHYCRAKLDANPENEVALFSMGSTKLRLLIFPPTRDLQEILDCITRKNHDPGRLRFLEAVRLARTGFTCSCTGFTCSCPNKQKRMLFFAGGLTDLSGTDADIYGKELKDLGIAVDVVNFHLEENPKYMGPNRFGRVQLDAFVTAANRNDNSHIEHVEPGHSICEVLSKSILKKTLRLCRKKNHHKKATGKNQAAADNKHVPNLNRFEALSLDNEYVKLGIGKMVAC